MFVDCLGKAEASRDDGVIAFTKAVYAWLLREHRYEKQRLKKSTLDTTNLTNNLRDIHEKQHPRNCAIAALIILTVDL